MADISYGDGDIVELEGDAIVNPASVALWIASGVGGALEWRSPGNDRAFFALPGALADEAVRAEPPGLPAGARR